jgi:Ni/Co efflux regulator RcnB
MKRLLCAVSAIALILPDAAALAAQMQSQAHGQRGARSAQGAKTRQGRPAKQRQAQPNRQQVRTRTVTPQVTRPTRQVTRQVTTRQVTRPTRQVTRQVTTRQVTRPTRQVTRQVTTRQVDRQTRVFRPGYRPRNFRPIRVSTFRYPRGYHYRRFRTGLLLPRLFLSSSYYFYDWGALGLGPPPPGYVWVRYGPDLLLVNRYNGRIADVIYGAFY